MEVCYTDRALEELETGLLWYSNISKSLGEGFLEAIEEKVEFIKNNPRACQVVYGEFRAAFLQRFPFSIIYLLDVETIVIHAVFDNRQDQSKLP